MAVRTATPRGSSPSAGTPRAAWRHVVGRRRGARTASTRTSGPRGPAAVRRCGSGRLVPEKAPHLARRCRPARRAADRRSPARHGPAATSTRRSRRCSTTARCYAGHLDQRRARRAASGDRGVALVTPALGRAVRARRRRVAGLRHAGRRVRARRPHGDPRPLLRSPRARRRRRRAGGRGARGQHVLAVGRAERTRSRSYSVGAMVDAYEEIYDESAFEVAGVIGYYVHHQWPWATRAGRPPSPPRRPRRWSRSPPCPGRRLGRRVDRARARRPRRRPARGGRGRPTALGAPARCRARRAHGDVSAGSSRTGRASWSSTSRSRSALLVRLHGVPVVTFALPGDRGDATPRARLRPGRHGPRVLARGARPASLGGLTTATCGEAPPGRGDLAVPAVPPDPVAVPRTVLVLSGAGGAGRRSDLRVAARRATPGWTWTVLDGTPGSWVDDPWPLICAADVVVTHAGQNAIADVAAAERPAIVVPQDRPHDEQRWTARALAADGGYPVVGPGRVPRRRVGGAPRARADARRSGLAALERRRWRRPRRPAARRARRGVRDRVRDRPR